MVGLVLVSHCRDLALAVVRLARGVSAKVDLPVAAAGGTGDDHEELGTDAMDILEAIEAVYSDDGVLVLMDLGSAVLSAKMAVEFLEGERAEHVLLCSAPLVEGAVSAAVQIAAGAVLGDVAVEVKSALQAKQLDLGDVSPADVVGDAGTAGPVSSEPAVDELSFSFVSRLKNGLHARPASLLVAALSPLKADVFCSNKSRNRGPQSARSINKLALLGILLGDEVELRMSGEDAAAALTAVKKIVTENFGEPDALGAAPPTRVADTAGVEKAPAGDEGIPLTMASGIAIGILYREGELPPPPKRALSEALLTAEIERFDEAIAETKATLEANAKRLVKSGHGDEAAIFTAQALILSDADILDDVKKTVRLEKICASYVYAHKMAALAAAYGALEGDYMPQRAIDVNDVATAVIRKLEGGGETVPVTSASGDEGVIIAAREVRPSMIAKWGGRLRGVISEIGGKTSHVAILARSLNIPGISGYRFPAEVPDGTRLIMDGLSCTVTVNPDDATLTAYHRKLADWEERKKQALLDSAIDAVTRDGIKLFVRANIGNLSDAQQAQKYHAEGVGLLRSEFLFLSRTEAPDEEAQTALLRQIVECFPKHPVTIRTIDIGGDKPLPYLKQAKEENPFLGVRGVRLCQKEPDVFLTHLRAILRAAAGFSVKIMVPMISTVEELEFCRDMLEKAHIGLEKDGVAHKWPAPLGIMVETPAAALMAEELAKKADFFSIGSNDLTQYTMAAERGNSKLSVLADPRQPPVLRMIQMTVSAAVRAGIPVSVCGEMAGDPALAVLLAGIGVRELSMSAASIGAVKKALTQVAVTTAGKLAESCLRTATLEEVTTALASI